MNEKFYAVRGVLTQRQLDSLGPAVYEELQVFDPATSELSDGGKNPPFAKIVEASDEENE